MHGVAPLTHFLLFFSSQTQPYSGDESQQYQWNWKHCTQLVHVMQLTIVSGYLDAFPKNLNGMSWSLEIASFHVHISELNI